MQNPHRTRYYITKSGETPTVRSVQVALADGDCRNDQVSPAPTVEAQLGRHPVEAPTADVKRRVKDVFRRRGEP